MTLVKKMVKLGQVKRVRIAGMCESGHEGGRGEDGKCGKLKRSVRKTDEDLKDGKNFG